MTTLVGWGSYIVFVESSISITLANPISSLLAWMFGHKVIALDELVIFVANFLSWVCGVVFAFVTNKLWVFNSKSWKAKKVVKEAVSFVSSRAITGVLEIFGVPLLASTGFDNFFYDIVEKMGLSMKIFYTDGIYSKVAFAVVVIILNYVFSKLIVFKDKSKD
ncbi:MAG: GtrA family protein [Acutalibacteraceae bacterium]